MRRFIFAFLVLALFASFVPVTALGDSSPAISAALADSRPAEPAARRMWGFWLSLTAVIIITAFILVILRILTVVIIPMVHRAFERHITTKS